MPDTPSLDTFYDEARIFLEDRRGRLLYVGADPSEPVLALARAGRFVSVNHVSQQVAQGLRERLRTEGLERMVTLDPRPFAGVSFEMSAFDGIVLADLGDPLPTAKALFKQIKHDLKMGGRVIARVPVRRDHAGHPRLIKALRGLDGALARVPGQPLRLPPERGLERGELLEFAQKYLKIDQIRYDTALPRVPGLRLPAGLAARLGQASLGAHLARLPGYDAACTMATVRLTNEKDFGTVFMKHVQRP